MINQLNPERERDILRNEAKALDIMFDANLPKSTRPLPRHEIDGIDGVDVELQWANGRGEIARVYLLFRGNEYDITDIVRTNRDGSLTTLVEDLFEEVAELRREDFEEHDMSGATQEGKRI